MKKLFSAFIILLFAVGLGFLIHQDPGYVMVSYDHWLIATTIWVAIPTLFIVFYLGYLCIRLIKNIFALPNVLARRRKLRDALKYRKNITLGLSEFSAGHFKKAEKYFLKIPDHAKSHINFLWAAKAAQAQQAITRRDDYLKKAFLCEDRCTFSILLTQAQLLIQSEQFDEARIILKKLLLQEPRNVMVLNGLKSIPEIMVRG